MDYSLIGDTFGLNAEQLFDINAGTGNLLNVDPMLETLQNNGGTTETHELLAGSPAIGVITPGGKCVEPDQRGVPRSAPCDIGAYEAP